jgi:hypothetical protein
MLHELPTIPGREIASYAAKFGVTSIFIAGAEDGAPPLLLGAGAIDLTRALNAAQARHPREFVGGLALLWCAWGEARSVGRLHRSVLRDVRARDGGIVDLNLVTLKRTIDMNAMRLTVRLSDHARTLAKVGAATARISEGVEASRLNGVLSQFNETYRKKRLEAQANGQRILPYEAALGRLRRALASHAASRSTGELPLSLMESVFGPSE